MKLNLLISALLIFVSILQTACTQSEIEKPLSISIKGDRLNIEANSKFLSHIEIISLGGYETRRVDFQSVGKMIALSNASNELTGSSSTWAELDPLTTKDARLVLLPEPVGVGYGVTSISSELTSQIKVGQIVHLKHYRVQEAGWSASIVKIISNVDVSTSDVVFRVTNGHDLYPGTTCEIRFPLLQAQAIKVSSTALVHHGLDEFVWQEVSPNEFIPRKVTPVEGSADEVILSTGVSEKTRIIGRGAILLKPQIKSILSFNGEQHAHK